MKSKNKSKSMLTRMLDCIINTIFICCILSVLYIVFQVFFGASFHIPSDSMEPSLKTGDNIIVNKLSMGARLFNINAALNKEDITIHRLPGIRKVKRGDVLVFNFPYTRHPWDSIGFDLMKYYVKRCIALPGDTLAINDGFFKVRNFTEPLGNPDSQRYISTLSDENAQGVVFYCYPPGGNIHWSVRNFGPLSIPSKNQTIKMDFTNYILYRNLIEWEQKKKLTVKDDIVFMNDSLIYSYQFKENYYFMAGDKLENSQDSRYWGLLPESYIVGKASFIWNSKDPQTGKIRWNRIFKKIK